jgi:hypothetical protein
MLAWFGRRTSVGTYHCEAAEDVDIVDLLETFGGLVAHADGLKNAVVDDHAIKATERTDSSLGQVLCKLHNSTSVSIPHQSDIVLGNRLYIPRDS